MKPIDHVECKFEAEHEADRLSMWFTALEARSGPPDGSLRRVLDSCLGALASLLQGGWVAPDMLVPADRNLKNAACPQPAPSGICMSRALQLDLLDMSIII